MAIRAIHHVSLLVADTERALAFYRDLLGLKVIDRPQLGFPGAWIAIGEQQLHLLELPNPDAESERPDHVGRDRHLALAVEGLDELAKQLSEAGIAISKSRSGRNAIFCRDPDGNGVELITMDFRKKINLDFEMFPSMEKGYLLVPGPPEALNDFPELHTRCSAAIYMVSHVGGKSTRSVISNEVHKAAYIRAALSEFVGMEDVAKLLVDKKYKNEILIDKCNNPLFHVMKLLRNYNIHVGSSVCLKVPVSVIAGGEELEINTDVIDNLNVESLKALRAGRYYTDTQMDRMVKCFTLEQNKLGVCNLLLNGILLYAELLVDFLTKSSTGYAKSVRPGDSKR